MGRLVVVSNRIAPPDDKKASAGGLAVGILGAVSREWRLPFLHPIYTVYVECVRNTPFIVQLYFIYFGLPFMGLQLDAITSTIVAFTAMSSAYISEIIRSSLQAVDKGQWEAAKSLGLRTPIIYRKIIIPQAFRIALPPLSNVLLDMVKSTSLTAMITVPEIFNKAKIVGGAKSDYMTVYICVALIYWVICSLYAIGQTRLEQRMATY